MQPIPSRSRGVRDILMQGIFWRILIIEGILLIFSLLYRWVSEDAGPADLFWYAIRILILVGIIILFLMITLNSFLARWIISPLEAIARANQQTCGDFSEARSIDLPPEIPGEIRSIVTTRDDMLARITRVSEERLRLLTFITDTFGRYLSAKVVDEILNSRQGTQIGGTRKTVTVLMSDLRGFTGLSEDRDPAELVSQLNTYLREMSAVILEYDGIIDEFIGDAILAVFGALTPRPSDPDRAVACALEMQNRLIRLNEQLEASGFPKLEMGIGINTGSVIVGNIGSELRMKFGIVGDPVNRASRIESNSIGGQVLIGESTYRMVRDRVTATAPKIMMMKGLKKPLVFYSITGITLQDRHISLNQPEGPGNRLDIHIAGTFQVIEDKVVLSPEISGHTLSLEENRIVVQTETPIPPLTDIKITLDFCTKTRCLDDIYAKCMETTPKDHTFISHLHITAISPEDRGMIRAWLAQVSS